jgi:predicted phage-related endonuclease
MSKQRVTPKSRADWLDIRKGFVGASEAAALLHVHPWLTLMHLWALKAGRIDPEPENPAMRRGKLLEAPALAMLAEERPDWTITPNPMPGGFLVVDDVSGICATPDATATAPDRPGEGILQVKSIDPLAFKKNWLTKAGDVEAPLHVLIQTAVEINMVGASWGTIVALVVGQGIDLHILEMPQIDGLIEKLTSANQTFWRLVETGERPPPDYERDLALIAQLNKAVSDKIEPLDLSGDNSFSAAISDYLDAKTVISAAEKRKATAEAEIRDKLADATAATAGDFLVTAKLVTRAEHIVRATSYRQLRIKDRGMA